MFRGEFTYLSADSENELSKLTPELVFHYFPVCANKRGLSPISHRARIGLVQQAFIRRARASTVPRPRVHAARTTDKYLIVSLRKRLIVNTSPFKVQKCDIYNQWLAILAATCSSLRRNQSRDYAELSFY